MSVSKLRPNPPFNTASSEFSAAEVNVTPAIAEQWLGKMPRNRHLAPIDVAKYARAMAAGHWHTSGEAIKFDRDGNLIDGQHRLHAVVSYGKPIKFLVVRGLDPAAQDVMDTGKKRNAADVLSMNGFPNASNVAASARLALAYTNGELRSAGQKQIPSYTNTEIMDYVLANSDLCDAVSHVAGLRSRLPIRPATSAFTLFILRRVDHEQADGFFADLASMRTEGSGDPKYTLLRRLNSAKQGNEVLSAVSESHYIFRAWNALREGQQLSALKTGNNHGGFDFQVPA